MGEKDADVIECDLGSLSAIVHRYPDPATCDWFVRHGKPVRVRYLEHDWTLNKTVLIQNPPPQTIENRKL